MRLVSAFFAILGTLVAATTAMAAQPTPWQLWHQPAGSEMMANIEWFDLYTLWFIIPITIFVLILLLIVIFKFNAKANPTPSKTTHNLGLEAAWTFIPILLLVFIAIPSFTLLDEQLAPTEEPALTVKATGVSWAWEYEYQDGSEISFSSYLLNQDGNAEREDSPEYKDGQEKEAAARAELGKTDLAVYPKLLTVDNELVVPAGKMVRVLVTASGVIHNFAMPAFGVKIDAIPGRLNETWFKAEKEGLYHGQCSELCGKYHSFMPIVIRAVSDEQFNTWQAAAKAGDVESANQALMAEIELKKNVKVAGN